jgi:hypothetical protein
MLLCQFSLHSLELLDAVIMSSTDRLEAFPFSEIELLSVAMTPRTEFDALSAPNTKFHDIKGRISALSLT